MDSQLMNILAALEELREDDTVPKNIKVKIQEASEVLNKDDDVDVKLKIDKALQLLEEITEDSNVKPHTRAELWNIVSMLESF